MAEDKLIKSGQFTFRRLVFLILCGLILFLIVAFEKLALGYLLLTAVLCLLLFLIAIDYGVAMEKVELQATPSQAPGAASQESAPQAAVATATRDSRPRRRSSRPAKRRR